MTWKIVQARSIGTTHLKNGESCQDECLARTFSTSDTEEYFLGLLSDGAGSAIRGGLGASIACNSGSAIIEKWIRECGHINGVVPSVVTNWVLEIRQKICEAAEVSGLNPRDFACTLLGTLIGPRSADYFQIGDGAIVVKDGDYLDPVFWPDNGEYANLTYFITDDDSLNNLHSQHSGLLPDGIAMFSDGLQRLALNYESETVHEPFFEPMFDRITKADAKECDRLSAQLAEFLSSEKINERTDDDKSLILSTRNRHIEG